MYGVTTAAVLRVYMRILQICLKSNKKSAQVCKPAPISAVRPKALLLPTLQTNSTHCSSQ